MHIAYLVYTVFSSCFERMPNTFNKQMCLKKIHCNGLNRIVSGMEKQVLTKCFSVDFSRFHVKYKTG